MRAYLKDLEYNRFVGFILWLGVVLLCLVAYALNWF